MIIVQKRNYCKTIQLTYCPQTFLARPRQIADGIFHHYNYIENSIGDVKKESKVSESIIEIGLLLLVES